MITLYFKTEKATLRKVLELQWSGEIVVKSSLPMTCGCGETSGYYSDTCALILCPTCFENADRMERGEEGLLEILGDCLNPKNNQI